MKEIKRFVKVVLFIFFYANVDLKWNYLSQDKEPCTAEEPSDLIENVQEEHPDPNLDEQEEQKTRQKEQVQKILTHVRQNFGKIYVAPEFNEEDLVPVEMPDLDMSDVSDSDGEAVDEGDSNDGVKDDTAAEPAVGGTETEESKSVITKASKAKSSREVIRELDGKIFKYKQFLEQAKSKRFSAIRSVLCNEMHFFLTS